MLAALRRVVGYDTRIIEVLHLCLLAVWCTLLVLPPPLFATASMHARMASKAPEVIWGAGALVALFIVLIGLLKDSPEWRRLGSMLGVLWWGNVAVLGLMSDPSASGPWVYFVFTNFLGWAYIKGRG